MRAFTIFVFSLSVATAAPIADTSRFLKSDDDKTIFITQADSEVTTNSWDWLKSKGFWLTAGGTMLGLCVFGGCHRTSHQDDTTIPLPPPLNPSATPPMPPMPPIGMHYNPGVHLPAAQLASGSPGSTSATGSVGANKATGTSTGGNTASTANIATSGTTANGQIQDSNQAMTLDELNQLATKKKGADQASET